MLMKRPRCENYEEDKENGEADESERRKNQYLADDERETFSSQGSQLSLCILT
jgi:hypothetical protein